MTFLALDQAISETTMKRSPDNRSPRPPGSQAGRKVPESAPTTPTKSGTHPTVITVQCPNPGCRKRYTVRISCAGKKGRCKCGALFSIPKIKTSPPGAVLSAAAGQPGQKAAPREAGKEGEGLPHEEVVLREGEDLTKVHVGCIGRGHAGKTALLRTLGEGPVGDFFPSGLHVDARDPREVTQMIREDEEAQRRLHQFGLPPTLKASEIRYYLYDGAVQQVVYRLCEVIGQVLTHTLPDSAAEQQTRYTDYLRSLVDTHVLWVVVPCPPPSPSARDRRRYANDLHITLAYLREALRLRSLEQPVAVALVLSKIDALFKDAEEARTSLTDEVLRTSFGPLVHLIEQSPRISDAVIIPVTAFGFGNAVLREEGGEREGAQSEAEEEPFGSEPIWLLREGASAQPENLDTLFIWTLLFGLLNEAGHGILEEDTELGQICRALRSDLHAIDPWLLPITGGIAGGGSQAAQMQSAR